MWAIAGEQWKQPEQQLASSSFRYMNLFQINFMGEMMQVISAFSQSARGGKLPFSAKIQDDG